MLVQIVLLSAAKAVSSRVFSYAVPQALQDRIQVGHGVWVQLGQQKKAVSGLVVSIDVTSATVSPGTKFIESLQHEEPLLTPQYLQFLQAVAQATATPLSDVVACALPSGLTPTVPAVKWMLTRCPQPTEPVYYQLPSALRVSLEHWQTQPKKTYGLAHLAKQWQCAAAEAKLQCQKLQQAGILRQAPEKPVAKPRQARIKAESSIEEAPKQLLPRLNESQQSVLEALLAMPVGEACWLYGVTGSGKTAVYQHLMQHAFAQQQQVLFLVPEIVLTQALADRFYQLFGREQTVVWHSQCSPAQRLQNWQAMARGDIRLVIGARSAVFAPLARLGLIILDEAHEQSFKQESPAPRYYCVSVAQYRAKQQQARLVLGSATPDVDSVYRLTQHDKTRLLRLPTRYGNRPMARVRCVDMRQHKGKTILAPESLALLQEGLAQQEQAIVLMNRRGFYTVLSCAHCEQRFECPQCSMALTLHQPKSLLQAHLQCHCCGFRQGVPDYCPTCASESLVSAGLGIQQVEQALAQALPMARLLRLDGDTIRQKEAYGKILGAFQAHEADILVGTQLVAKGLDIAGVTRVVVIQADAAMNMPDFRSEERTFQLLTQVAGRAGRGDKPGQVLLQTYQPQHEVLQLACAQDFDGFYQHTLAQRQSLGWPPFSRLFRLLVTGEDEARTQAYAEALTAQLNDLLLKQEAIATAVVVLGPAPCVLFRVQNRHRFQSVLQVAADNTALEEACQAWLSDWFLSVQPPAGIHCLWDPDCQSLL